VDEAISFGIAPQTQPRPFEFVHVTDIHAVPEGGKRWTAFTDEMKAGTADYRFIMDTGDEGDLPNLKAPDRAAAEMQAARGIFQAIPLPSYHTAGNHDVMAGAALRAGWKADSSDFGYGLYCRLFGPPRWSFTYGGVHFVGIDTIAHDGGMGKPAGGQDWLAKDLASIPADMPVYLFGHISPGGKRSSRSARSATRSTVTSTTMRSQPRMAPLSFKAAPWAAATSAIAMRATALFAWRAMAASSPSTASWGWNRPSSSIIPLKLRYPTSPWISPAMLMVWEVVTARPRTISPASAATALCRLSLWA
jgi:hypothetical protein